MRHQLSFWSNPWRPAQDWFSDSPAFGLWGDDDESNRTYLPAAEVEETNDHFVVTLDVPGVSKEDIRIELVDGRLVISAERKFNKSEERDNRLISERRYGKFQRIFDLGDQVDPEKIEAAYQDGVLKIALAKAERTKPKQIPVKSDLKGGLFERLVGETRKVASEAKKVASVL